MDDIAVVESIESGRRILRIVDLTQPATPVIPSERLRHPLWRIARSQGKQLVGDFVTGKVRIE